MELPLVPPKNIAFWDGPPESHCAMGVNERPGEGELTTFKGAHVFADPSNTQVSCKVPLLFEPPVKTIPAEGSNAMLASRRPGGLAPFAKVS